MTAAHTIKTETLIVGGGLSGLSLASHLEDVGRDYVLVEARKRFGGRILTETVDVGGRAAQFDMGPAWFWDGQPRMAELLNRLQLKAFYQFSEGTVSFQDQNGRVHHDKGFASMAGSYRLTGGVGRLIDALVADLPDDNLKIGMWVTHCRSDAQGMVSTCVSDSGDSLKIESKSVVLALPPRVAAERIELGDTVNADQISAMRTIPTWMAGHAKFVAVYETAFWRDAGLSGDAMSHFGPLVEIHDASPVDESCFALFGFVGVPAEARCDEGSLKDAALAQLRDIFGQQAETPIAVFYKDWAEASETAVQLDQQALRHHPQYGLPVALQTLCNGRLLLGSTETASAYGGYLEGALEASERVLHALLQHEAVS